jgi:two-component system, OmpR family, response regulator VicR
MLSKAFTTRQVAELAHVSQSTIANWISAGILPAFRTPGGHHRILPQDFVRFLEEHGFPVPEELQAEARLRLLLVDEPAAAQQLAARLASLNRFEISVAEGGAEGLLRVGLERPDAVIVDLHLQDLSGAEICRQVRLNPQTQRTLLFALSGRKNDQVRSMVQKMGFHGFFFKPVEPKEIVASLDELRQGQRRQSQLRG